MPIFEENGMKVWYILQVLAGTSWLDYYSIWNQAEFDTAKRHVDLDPANFRIITGCRVNGMLQGTVIP